MWIWYDKVGTKLRGIFYSWDNNYTEVKITNVRHSVDSYDYLYVYFDIEKTYQKPSSSYEYVGTIVRLVDSDGYVLEQSIWLEDNLSVGDKMRDQYVYFDLDNWDGNGDLTITFSHYD